MEVHNYKLLLLFDDRLIDKYNIWIIYFLQIFISTISIHEKKIEEGLTPRTTPKYATARMINDKITYITHLIMILCIIYKFTIWFIYEQEKNNTRYSILYYSH